MIEEVRLPAHTLIRELFEDPVFRAEYNKIDKEFKELERVLRSKVHLIRESTTLTNVSVSTRNVKHNEVKDELPKDAND